MSRIARRRPLLLIAAVTVLPLALLTYFSLRLATQAVERQVEARLASTASLSSTVVAQELRSLVELAESYAARPSLVAAAGDRRAARSRDDIRFQLKSLRDARKGVSVAFLVSTEGRVIDIVPPTPSIVGADFSYRDWYRGLTRTRRSYISEAIVGAATGNPRVVVAATYVRSRREPPVAILGVGYSLEYLQSFSDRIAAAQGVKVNVTDQRGTLVASSGGLPKDLVSRRHDPRVRAALRGRSGIIELETPDGSRLSAYAPVSEAGWTVTTSVPSNAAYAAVGDLRAAVLSVVALLALGLLVGLALLARALRQRARAEHEARELAAINRAVLDSTPNAITMTDLDGNVVLRNAALEELTKEIGETRGDSPGERLRHAADRTADPAGFRAALQSLAEDSEAKLEYEFELADVRRSFVLFSAPVAARDGQPMGRMFTMREVTREREADRLKSDLLATVSHELRTPLTGILGFAELLLRSEPEAETRARYVQTIYTEAQRLTALINDFLDLQRIESGSFALALEPFDLREVLSHQVVVFSRQSDEHPVSLSLPDDDPLVVVGEAERVAQVLANLISNAIKYSPEGGHVDVAVRRVRGAVRVEVRDHGLGIPADQQASVFQKFFRVDTTDTRRIGGTGLGLALAKEIVEGHSGRMGFDSVHGEGSTFWFELPSGVRDGDGRGRVLVIEDDLGTATLLGDHLGTEGFSVEIVTTAEEALARARSDPPSAVCLDIRLSGNGDGWEVLEQLKAHSVTAGIPVIVCTGGNGRGRAAALGASDFLTKPFSREQLLEAVRRLLPERRGSVLVVDDEEPVRRLVVETLSPEFETREAADGIEALELVRDRRPDAVVLDLVMPRLDGFAVLEELQRDEETRMLPVIVLTGRRLSREERSLLSSRTVALLEKSLFSAKELARLVSRAVGG